jgi:hypothetical protein
MLETTLLTFNSKDIVEESDASLGAKMILY